jgi:hypothetical protein
LSAILLLISGEKIMKQFFSKAENIYVILVFALILSKLFLGELWMSDQLIIYNFISILMITVIVNLLLSRNNSFLKYFPLIILIYVFFNPSVLRTLFFVSHILILLLFIFLLIKWRYNPLYSRNMGATVIPLEIMILFFFL